MEKDVMIKVKHAAKKYSKSLKRSMLYGMADIGRNMLGLSSRSQVLRKNEFWAVDDISFELKRGETLGIIGPNGSGKTTLLKMLNGIFWPDKGKITVRGRVGALIEVGAGFHPLLTGRENIYANAAILGMSKKEVDEKFDDIVAFAEIGDFLDTPVKFYSSGMFVRLGFSIAIHCNPDLMLIDEILAVGDVGFRMKCFSKLLVMKKSGASILLISHNTTDIFRVCNNVMVLNKGKIIHYGDISKGIVLYQSISSKNYNMNLVNNDLRDKKNDTPKIIKVESFDGANSLKDDFKTGDTIFFKIKIRAESIFEDCRIIAHIESPNIGRLGSFSSFLQKFDLTLKIGINTIWLKMPNIPLLIGNYQLYLDLYGPEIEDFYDQKYPAIDFNIIGDNINAFGFGLMDYIYFNHEWLLE